MSDEKGDMVPMPFDIRPDEREVLKQICNSMGGIPAGYLASKDAKKRLYDKGLVWPAYGTDFKLTPKGVRIARCVGLEPSPFCNISTNELLTKRDQCCDSDWDRERFDAWMEKAQL